MRARTVESSCVQLLLPELHLPACPHGSCRQPSGLTVPSWPPCLKRPSTSATSLLFLSCELLCAVEAALSASLPESRAWHRVGTGGIFAKIKKKRRKKGLRSCNQISKSVVSLGLTLYSRSLGLTFSQLFMVKIFKLLWRLSPPYIQGGFVQL